MGDIKEYFTSAFEEKLLKKLPEHAGAQVTPATQLLEKRREMMEVESALDAQKDDFQVKMDALKQRRDELQRKESQLQDSLTKFDRFLKENDARRDRAERKAKEERDLTQKKEEEIADLKREKQGLEQRRERGRKNIEQHEVFEKYLKQVLAIAPEYTEINELIDRYETLRATNKDLHERERANQARHDTIKNNFAAFKEESRVKLLDASNQQAALRQKKEEAQAQLLHWESQFANIQSLLSSRTLLLGRIKLAIANLYELVQRSTRHGQAVAEPTLQLDKIHMFAQDLEDITTELAPSIVSSP